MNDKKLTDAGRNEHYEGLFEGETIEERAARLAAVRPKMQAFASMEQMADLRSQLANAKHLREIITPHDNDCAFMQGGRMACNCNGTRWFGYSHRDTVDVLGVWALCNWFAALAASEARCAELTSESRSYSDLLDVSQECVRELRKELARVRALVEGAEPIAWAITDETKAVSITFSKGFADHWKTDHPELKTYDFYARPNLNAKEN